MIKTTKNSVHRRASQRPVEQKMARRPGPSIGHDYFQVWYSHNQTTRPHQQEVEALTVRR